MPSCEPDEAPSGVAKKQADRVRVLVARPVPLRHCEAHPLYSIE